MEYDGVNSIVCDAEESDWLDISYSQRKYVETAAAPAKKRFNFAPKFKFNFKNIKLSRPLKIVAIAVLCVAVLAALLFVDGNFGKEVFDTVKAAYSSTLFGSSNERVSASITIPVNCTLLDVNDGVSTFTGGKVVLSFTDGTVQEVTDTTVTVAIDDNLTITYDGLTDVYVAVGDTLTANTLLGKYNGTFTATITQSGETVKDVVGSETQLTWIV